MDALLVAKRVLQRGSKTQADVLDSVMVVDVRVAGRLDLERDSSVLAEVGEHVVEEADASGRLRLSGGVEIEFDYDFRFGGLSFHRCGAIHRGHPRIVDSRQFITWRTNPIVGR